MSLFLFQIDDITSCDTLCNYNHISLYYPRNKRKRIKIKKENQNKLLVSKYIITKLVVIILSIIY